MKIWTIPNKVHKYIHRKDKDRALGLLSKITAINQSGFITDTDESYLRFVGVFRVQLLMEWGYYREALAWACLECELYPDNMRAFVFKESIKQKINNIPKDYEVGISTIQDDWQGIAGMRELKAEVEQDLIIPLKKPSLYKIFNIPLPNGYLFYGPPGCGKTYFAEKLAQKIGYDFMKVVPSDVGSTYVHGTQLEIRKVFKEAKERSPVLLFFDEFESIAPKRVSSEVSFHYKSEVSEMLTQLDNISKSGILFIAATNYINSIDDAVLRPGRIDKRIFIAPPDFEARRESFKIQLKDRPKKRIRYDYMAELTEYFTHADIKLVCNDAARIAAKRKVVISTDILGSVVINYQPQLSESKISEYL